MPIMLLDSENVSVSSTNASKQKDYMQEEETLDHQNRELRLGANTRAARAQSRCRLQVPAQLQSTLAQLQR